MLVETRERRDYVYLMCDPPPSTHSSQFRHITEFQEKSNKPVLGIVLYAGEHVLPFGDAEHSRYAVPLSVFF